jgi:large subunit ribosomal protein L17
MRHLKKGRKLSRNSTHRLAMFRNMVMSLITHERIRTTTPKAKELRPIIERYITLAKRAIATGDPIKVLHARRLIQARLGPVAKIELVDGVGESINQGNVVEKIFKDLAPRFADRPGGYTRIIKTSYRRLGDNGETALIEFLKEGEVKVVVKKEKEKPAPVLTSTPAPAPETPNS